MNSGQSIHETTVIGDDYHIGLWKLVVKLQLALGAVVRSPFSVNGG